MYGEEGMNRLQHEVQFYGQTRDLRVEGPGGHAEESKLWEMLCSPDFSQ